MKVLNVLGIILAWFLSIALVLMLVAAPLTMSALSLLNPENLTELVGDVLTATDASAETQEEYTFEKLSVETDGAEEVPDAEEAPSKENVLGGLEAMLKDVLKDFDMEGVQGETQKDAEALKAEILQNVLESKAVGQVLDAYMSDLGNAIVGKTDEAKFTPELLVKVVEENIDEILTIVEDAGAKIPEEQKSQLKNEIQSAVRENAEQIMAEIPAPKDLVDNVLGENPEMGMALELVARRNAIKGAFVGAIVVLSLLIFGLRYPGFRGLRWLSVDLFVAGGINVVICLIWGASSAVITELIAGTAGNDLASAVGGLLSKLTTGLIVRMVIMLVAAIALMVGYVLLKKFAKNRKAAAYAEPVVDEQTVEGTVQAPSYVPEAAPVYTSVDVTPELNSDPAPEEKPAE